MDVALAVELDPGPGLRAAADAGASPSPSPSPSPAPTCICTMDFRPVCGSDGKTYSNKCMAACVLGKDGSWKDGECPKPCPCSQALSPVCGSDGVTYVNPCLAACALGAAGKWEQDACPPPACRCTKELRPVCGSDGQTYNNKCLAACALGEDGVWAQGACQQYDPFWGCTKDTQCLRNTCADGPCPGMPASSLCFHVSCSGQDINGVGIAPCQAVWVDPESQRIAVCGFNDMDPVVSCPSANQVQCLADPCAAAAGSCKALAAAGAVCEPVYCQGAKLIDGSRLTACSAVYRFANGSLAACDTGVEWEQPPCVCPAVVEPVCGEDGRTYQNECQASCEDVKKAYDGPCDTAESPDDESFPSCPPSAPGVECLVDPCQGKTCPAYPNATCHSNYCANATYHGQRLLPCSAVWVNPAGRLANCRPPSPSPSPSPKSSPSPSPSPRPSPRPPPKRSPSPSPSPSPLPSPSPSPSPSPAERPLGWELGPGCPASRQVQCKAAPCSVSSCPPHPGATCLPVTCTGAEYRGEPVEPCSALWVDGLGTPLSCQAAGPSDNGNGDEEGPVLQGMVDLRTCDGATTNATCTDVQLDGCGNATCEGHPYSVCAVKTCGGMYGNITVPTCEPVWHDPDTGKLATCGEGGDIINDITECGEQFLSAKCTLSALNSCKGAVCKAQPEAECLVKTCTATFRGDELPVCKAIWYDPSNQQLVDCSGKRSGGGVMTDITTCEGSHISALCTPDAMGACKAATCPGQPNATCIVKTCGGFYRGQPVNPCRALWYDKFTKDLVKCNTTSDEIEDVDDCPDDTNPGTCPPAAYAACENATCPAHPDASCIVKSCAATFRGRKLKPCTPIWYHARLEDVVDCTAQPPPPPGMRDITTCEGATASARCTKEAMSSCDNTTCEGHPYAKCIVKTCSGDYRGMQPPMCEALWYDKGSGDIITCGKGGDIINNLRDCAKDAVQALCKPEAMGACDGATCPAYPGAKCVVKTCSATYRGQSIQPCKPVWYDPMTMDLVNCTGKPAPEMPDITTCDNATSRSTCSNETRAACDRAKCVGYPTATCIVKPCGGTYRGSRVYSCKPTWYDEITGDLITCGKGGDIIDDLKDCGEESVSALCTPQTMDSCSRASCPAHVDATCIVKTCTATYRGESLQPCRPIWFDNSTGGLVTCAPSAACARCSVSAPYYPVCGVDKITYPTRCAAECRGIAITRDGKCNRCRADECTHGKLHDPCLLGSTKHCWAKKYECRSPKYGPLAGSAFLGLCLPKQDTVANATGSGRRLGGRS